MHQTEATNAKAHTVYLHIINKSSCIHMTVSIINLQSFHICERRGNALVHGALSCEKAVENWAHMQELSPVSFYWLY